MNLSEDESRIPRPAGTAGTSNRNPFRKTPSCRRAASSVAPPPNQTRHSADDAFGFGRIILISQSLIFSLVQMRQNRRTSPQFMLRIGHRTAREASGFRFNTHYFSIKQLLTKCFSFNFLKISGFSYICEFAPKSRRIFL